MEAVVTRLSLLLPFVIACGGSSSGQPAAAPSPAPAPAAETAPAPPPEEEQPTREGTEALLCWESCVFDEDRDEDECRDECGLARQDE